jgi:DNA-binding transcriptional regulator YiaG
MTTRNLVDKLDKMLGEQESLGMTIKAIRMCEGMKQKEFADILGVTVSYLIIEKTVISVMAKLKAG